jgi:hypothetical protein
MADSSKPSKERQVKGSLLVDFVKMIRATPDLPWADHLPAEDLELVNQMILPASWYPLESFQRIGLAVFKLVAKENYDMLRAYGRSQADKLHQENPGMVSQGRPGDTLEKQRVIQQRFYSFDLTESEDVGPGHIIVHIYTNPEEVGVKMMIEINSGQVERLIELSGGTNIEVKLIEAVWEGADRSSLEVKWEE